jgi:DNA invertase Pin-like site-specific DNA recombinase
MEGVLAAFAQFDNDCRSDRTRAGMKAALEFGRWVFLAPIGYFNAPRAMGKSLMPHPERALLVRRAFEEYAIGRLALARSQQADDDRHLFERDDEATTRLERPRPAGASR